MGVSAGQAILIAPGRCHDHYFREGDLEQLSFFFAPAEQAKSIRDALSSRIRAYMVFPATAPMMEMARTIMRDWNERGSFQKEMRQSLLTSLMILVFRRYYEVTPQQYREAYGKRKSCP